jgi:hypothetical protein
MPINENSVYVQRFNMVMQPQERAMLQALAADAGQKESALIRDWIVAAYQKRFGKRNPGEPVPKYNSRAAIRESSRGRKR